MRGNICDLLVTRVDLFVASMRPPHNAGEYRRTRAALTGWILASMRPPHNAGEYTDKHISRGVQGHWLQ